jgi:glucokinase
MGNYLAVDIGGTKTQVARIATGNGKASIEETRTFKSGDFREAGPYFSRVRKLLKEVSKGNEKGLGFSSGGLIDTEKGIILDWTCSHHLEGVSIKERFRSLGLPVSVRNDVECFSMGEWVFGAGRARPGVMVGVIMGTGIGACMLLDGKPFKGSHGYAGEVGEFVIDGMDLEGYAGGAALKQISGVEGNALYGMAARGDSKALEAFRAYGERAGAVVRNVFSAYDPDVIVLGGSISRSFRFFSGSMESYLRNAFSPSVFSRIRVVPSGLENAGLLGAVVPLMG